MLMKIVVLVF